MLLDFDYKFICHEVNKIQLAHFFKKIFLFNQCQMYQLLPDSIIKCQIYLGRNEAAFVLYDKLLPFGYFGCISSRINIS